MSEMWIGCTREGDVMKAGVCGWVVVVGMGFGGIYAMEVKKTLETEGTVEVKKESNPVVCATTNQGVAIETVTRVSVLSTATTDFAGTALDKTYADCLTEFLQQYNKAFEACAKRQAWELCDVVKDKDGTAIDVIFTIEKFDSQELRDQLIKKLSEQLEDMGESGRDDEKAFIVTASPKTSWSIVEKLSWVPLWLFRKGLAELLARDKTISAALLSLLLLACPEWITTIVGGDILPYVAKKFAVPLSEAALVAMNISKEQIEWLLKYLKSALGV